MTEKSILRKTFSFISRSGLLLFVILSSLGFTTKKRSEQQYFSDIQNVYLYDSLFFISDIYSGIHIYSVNDPSSPELKGTIPLDGNSGLAVKDSIIYTNSYSTLLALKLNSDFSFDTVAVIWEGSNSIDDDLPMDEHHGFFGCGGKTLVTADGTGTGGSYAIFAVIDSFLYYIDYSSLITLDISDPDTLIELSRVTIDWTIETLFSTNDYLYVGGRGGMYVLDRVNPAHPKKVCTLEHFEAYDPVVVQDTVAYVTLRAGNWGGTAKDVLLVVSVADPSNAYILDEISTFTPYGLSIQDSLLFVSNGYNGFSLFNVENPIAVSRIKYWDTPNTKDFIWIDSILYTMCFTEVRIYNVEDQLAPVLLGTIK